MPSAISQQVLGLATSTSPGLAQAGGYNILPAGIVFPYAGGTAPTGFLLCEGQQISKTAYAALYASIGDDYATQINPTTGLAWAAPDADKFRVPDYRGLFLRGVGTPSGLDAVTRGSQQADKTKKNGLSNSGSNTVTGTAAGQSFSGTANVKTGGSGQDYYSSGNNIAPTNFVADSYSGSFVGLAASNAGFPIYTPLNHTHGSSSLTATAAAPTISSTDTETRPINKGVHYIIKA
jgi:microcystin-dependent protein